MTEPNSRRVAYLDGVRGVAAQFVVIHHFVLGFGSDHRKLDALFNGYTAVLIFFVLSGFVMSASSAKAELPLVFRAWTRYLRLALPMLPVALVAWLLIAIFPDASVDLGYEVHSAWSTRTYAAGTPPIWQVLTDAMIKPFVSGAIYLNTSTGTMGPEFIGSILTFILIRYCNQQWRPALLGIVGILCLTIYGDWDFQRDALFCFASGSLIWHYRAAIARIPDYLCVSAGLLTMPILVITAYGISVKLGSSYSFGPNGIVRLFAVGILIASVVGSRHLQTLFGSPFAVFLGRISFGVYLIHQPIESTLFAWLYELTIPHGVWLLLLFWGFALTSLLTGWLVTVAFDEPVVSALKAWSKKISARSRTLTVKPA